MHLNIYNTCCIYLKHVLKISSIDMKINYAVFFNIKILLLFLIAE